MSNIDLKWLKIYGGSIYDEIMNDIISYIGKITIDVKIKIKTSGYSMVIPKGSVISFIGNNICINKNFTIVNALIKKEHEHLLIYSE